MWSALTGACLTSLLRDGPKRVRFAQETIVTCVVGSQQAPALLCSVRLKPKLFTTVTLKINAGVVLVQLHDAAQKLSEPFQTLILSGMTMCHALFCEPFVVEHIRRQFVIEAPASLSGLSCDFDKRWNRRVRDRVSVDRVGRRKRTTATASQYLTFISQACTVHASLQTPLSCVYPQLWFSER